MIEISIHKIVKNYGFDNVLNEISFDIKKGEIISLIGENGSGKSTLLKLIAKEENPTSGDIAIRKGATVGYLKQIPGLDETSIGVEELLYKSVQSVIDMGEQLRKYELEMATSNELELNKLLKKYGVLQEKFLMVGGYEVHERVNRIINGFQISSLVNQKFNQLSGGEKTLVMFASLMIKNPDILLLDEPTNHLDIDKLEWLEGYLKNYSGTVLLVSHDRYFLDKVSKKTILIESGKEEIFFGNYSYYLEENEKRIMLQFKNYQDQQKQINAIKAAIKKLRDWGKIGNNERFFKRAKCMEQRLEKMEKLNKPKVQKEIPLQFKMKERSGNEVIVAKNLNLRYQNILFANASFMVQFKEHVCLVGKNGSGKSTLIKEILRDNPSIKIGTNLTIGYIEQEIFFENDNLTILEEAQKYFNGTEQYLRSALYKFMFCGENVYKRLSSLSGGEKVRLRLFCFIQQDVNLLLLDEPTNHIDITTREILENALEEYKGTIVFTSHDRYFINKAATKIIAIENYKLVEYLGNYDDYYNKANKI